MPRVGDERGGWLRQASAILKRGRQPEGADAAPPLQPASTDPPAASSGPPGIAREDVLSRDGDFLDAMFWIVLGRRIDEETRRTRGRQLETGHSRSDMLLAALSSHEFRQRYVGYHEFLDADVRVPGDDVLEDGLRTLGSTAAFVDACYACLLGRASDPSGRAFYVSQIEANGSRRRFVYTLLQSDEFAARYAEIAPAAGMIPIDVQLCELANPAKWDNPEWRRVLQALKLPAGEKNAMHRKAYEFTQTAWGLTRLGVLQPDAKVLSVGAGHESLVYWLANLVKLVVATDLYEAAWQASAGAEGDAQVLTNPEQFAPFAYRRDHLVFLQMDGRRLAFRDASFDAVYSLSSIEHFGGFAGARESVEDMARVLRPGGVMAVATEWRVGGPPAPGEEVFEPEEIRRLVDLHTLELIETFDDRVWARYQTRPVNLRRNRYETPHMLVEIDGTVFTSAMLFLRKR
jgi:SAM-dependent methyltransferase